MFKYTKWSVLLLAGVLTAGCISASSDNSTKTSSSTSKTADTSAESSASVTYAVGDVAVAGDVTHTVTSVEVLDEIPESYTLAEWELIAEPLVAADGFQWVHLTGEVTNNTGESQSVASNNLGVVDASGNEYSVSTDTTIYVDDAKSPVYLSIQPTQTVEWEGYFMVPADATGLVLRADDLSFFPESEVTIDLGL